MKNADMPAFNSGVYQGLTKREYFAAIAMQSMIIICKDSKEPDNVAIASVKFADLLLKHLER